MPSQWVQYLFIKVLLYLLQLDIQLYNRRSMSGQLEIQSCDRVFRSQICDEARLFMSLYKFFYFQLLSVMTSPPCPLLKINAIINDDTDSRSFIRKDIGIIYFLIWKRCFFIAPDENWFLIIFGWVVVIVYGKCASVRYSEITVGAYWCSMSMSVSRQALYKWSIEELRLATGVEGGIHLQHHLKLCSAYSGVPVWYLFCQL